MTAAIRLFDPQLEPELPQLEQPAGAVPSGEGTVAGIIRAYLAAKTVTATIEGISAGRFRNDIFYAQSFAAQFGPLRIEECRNTNITAWLAANSQWKSSHAKSDAVGVIVRCFRWAVDERLVPYCPYHRKKLWATPQPRTAIEPWEFEALMEAARTSNGLGPHRHPRRRAPKEQTPDLFDLAEMRERGQDPEQKRRGRKRRSQLPEPLFDYIDQAAHQARQRTLASAAAFRRAVWFLWHTGCRTCEMREAEWCHVRWEKGSIVLTKHKTDHTGEDRIIALTPAVLRLLRLMFKYRRPPVRSRHPRNRRIEPADPIFKNSRGGSWTNDSFSGLFRKYADLAGIRKDVTAYCLRHGFCVQALDNGELGSRQIADLMGHASTRYVDWYGRSARSKTDYLRENAAKVHARKAQKKTVT